MNVDEVAGEKKQRLSSTNCNRDIESYFSRCAAAPTLEQYSYYMLIALERELSFYHNKLIMVAESGVQRRKSVPDEFKPS